MNKKILESEAGFFNEIKSILALARQKVRAQVNTIMVEAYWSIGKRIVEQELLGKERADYGSYIVKRLSQELSNEFGRGFSIANLKNFRQFYVVFKEDSIGYTLCSQLGWSHIRSIMRVGCEKAREFYLRETIDQNWSVRHLERNIKSNYFSRLISNKNGKNEDKSNSDSTKHRAFIKDPYVLEFLDLSEKTDYRESNLEGAIVNNLQKFLLEMGKGFSFVGRQFRISTETAHFYIDLVFYNYLLKCFVVVDLKIEKLTHQDIGQMDMYVRIFDDLKRGEDDNPTIGIILCADKDETIVKYSVLKENEQLFASRYKIILPTEKELQEELACEARQFEELQKPK